MMIITHKGTEQMASKAQRRRARKQSKAAVASIAAKVQQEADEAPRTKDRPIRPTSQRLAQGRWNMPSGPGKREQPMTDEASDMIGRLYIEGKLTISQEQAGRRFQEAYEGYLASIGAIGYRSCLAGGSGAYDSGDGDHAAEQAYMRIRAKVGRVKIALLQVECMKLYAEKPHNLAALRNALNTLAFGA